jgi:hypothetical protein
MYCPFCGWELTAYRIRHGVHQIAYQCDNGACLHSPDFLAIEVLGNLPREQIIRRHTIEKEEHHDPPL